MDLNKNVRISHTDFRLETLETKSYLQTLYLTFFSALLSSLGGGGSVEKKSRRESYSESIYLE